MITDPYVTCVRALELSGWSEPKFYRKLRAGEVQIKRSDERGANGRALVLVRVASLGPEADARYWREEKLRKESNRLGLETSLPAPGCTDAVLAKAEWKLAVVKAALQIEADGRDVKSRKIELGRERGASYRSMQEWISRYRQYGSEGLIDKWGRHVKGAFTSILPVVQDFIQASYLSPERPSRTTVFECTVAWCAKHRLKTPSQASVNRFIDKLPEPVVIHARYGPQAYRAKAQPKIHRDYRDLAVGEIWVGDHRILDVFVRLDDHPDAPVFRPWLTAWMDLRSRTIVGWHLNESPGNAGTIQIAVRRGILQYGVPQTLYRDNGKDFCAQRWGGTDRKARRADFTVQDRRVLNRLGIDTINALPFTPWSKAIEPFFGHQLPEWEKTFPGWCGRDNKERPEKLKAEFKANAFITLDALRASLADRLERYHERPHSGAGMDGATPKSLWPGVEKRIPDPRALDVLMMPHNARKVTHQGIRIFGNRYWHSDLHLELGQLVEVRYDEADLRSVVVFKQNEFICEAAAQDPMPMRASRERMKEQARNRKQAREAMLNYRDHREVLMNPRADLVANSRETVSASAPPDPTPEPGGSVMPMITGFEKAASSRGDAKPRAIAREGFQADSRGGGLRAGSTRPSTGSGRPARQSSPQAARQSSPQAEPVDGRRPRFKPAGAGRAPSRAGVPPRAAASGEATPRHDVQDLEAEKSAVMRQLNEMYDTGPPRWIREAVEREQEEKRRSS